MALKILFADDQIPPDDVSDAEIEQRVWADHPSWGSGYQKVVNGFTAMRKIVRSLQDHGYHLSIARTQGEALRLISKDTFDIAIVDLAWVGDAEVPEHQQGNAGWTISDAIEDADRIANRQPTPQIIYSSRFPKEAEIVSDVARRKKLPVHKYYDGRDTVQLRAAIDFMESTFLEERRRVSGGLRDSTASDRIGG